MVSQRFPHGDESPGNAQWFLVDHERVLDSPAYAAQCRRCIHAARKTTILIIVTALCNTDDSCCRREDSDLTLRRLCRGAV
jgi:hypothetical protein